MSAFELAVLTTQINATGDTPKYSPRDRACPLLIDLFRDKISETLARDPSTGEATRNRLGGAIVE